MTDETFLDEVDVIEPPETKPISKLEDVIKIPDVMPSDEEMEALKKTRKIDANDIVADFVKRFGPEIGYRQSRLWFKAKLEAAPVVHRAQSRIMRLSDLHKKHTELRDPVIHGLLRRGEIMNIISAPKVGKSFMANDLATTIAQGGDWLGKFKTRAGRVLIIDNELHPETISFRTKLVAQRKARTDMGSKYLASMIDVISLRGELVDLKGLAKEIKYIARNEYVLIILDAFYRFLPPRTDENDNGQMATLYNRLDKYAAKTNSAICVIHHTSKGDQAGKKVTDVGAGAGVQSRATDTHLILRAFKTKKNIIRLDAAVRSFVPLDPFCIKAEFPTWRLDPTDPEELENEDRSPATNTTARDAIHQKLLDVVLKSQPMSIGKMHAMSCQQQLGLSFGTVRNLVMHNWIPNGKLIEVTPQAGSKGALYGAPGSAMQTPVAPSTQEDVQAQESTQSPAIQEENPLPPPEEIADILHNEESTPDFDDFITETDTGE